MINNKLAGFASFQLKPHILCNFDNNNNNFSQNIYKIYGNGVLWSNVK